MSTQGIRQSGAALLIAMLVMLLAIGSGLIYWQNRGAPEDVLREKPTLAAMARAKEAILGYAATYPDSHPGQVFGLLPLPDLGSSINTVTQEGVQAGNFTGNQQGLIVLGRLPWKSLSIAPPRDSSSECLWYAVSGNFQQEAPAGVVNWDTPGNFEVFSSGGTHTAPQSQTGSNQHNRPVAIIFAAGPVLPGQDRSPSSTDNVSECGGNYDAKNYLDPVISGAAIADIINYFNNPTKRNAYPNAPESLKKLLAGNVSDTAGVIAGTNQPLGNDRMLVITADEIFQRVGKRSDFRSRINNELLAEASSCFALQDASSPNDVTGLQPIAGAKYWGRADVVEWLNTCLSAKLSTTTRQWTNNLLYIMCNDGSTCLTVENSKTASTSTCKAAMVFSGSRKTGQQRVGAPALNNYIESNLASDSIITASPSFPLSDNELSSDTAICLNGSISFANELNNFSGVNPTINSQELITPNLAAKTLTLGNMALTTSVIDSATGGVIDRSRLYGCSWYAGAQIFGTGFRTYFKFEIKNDLAGEGFSFAFFDANRNPEINICGAGGEHLGYSGKNPDLAPILYPKMALEFDTTRQALTRNDTNDRHAALVYWGYSHDPASGNVQDDDNVHGYPLQPQTGYLDPRARASRFINSLRAATAEERTFHVRMDVVRNYNITGGYATYTINVWIYKIVMPGMDDTTKDYDADALDAPTLTDTLNIYDMQSGIEAFRAFRFGFTTGQSTRGQDIVLSNFELRTR